MLFVSTANHSLHGASDRSLSGPSQLEIPKFTRQTDLSTDVPSPTTIAADRLQVSLQINDVERATDGDTVAHRDESDDQQSRRRTTFLDLPQEILYLVYQAIFPEIAAGLTANERHTSRNFVRLENKLPFLSVGCTHDRYTAVSLLLVCRQTHDDVSAWIYGSRTFTLLSVSSARQVSLKLGATRLALLKRVEFLGRWGSSDSVASVSRLIKFLRPLCGLERLDLQWFSRGVKNCQTGVVLDGGGGGGGGSKKWTDTQLIVAQKILSATPPKLNAAFYRERYSRMRFCCCCRLGGGYRPDRDEERVVLV